MDKNLEHKIYLLCENSYNIVCNIIRDLQPIAFLISATLVVAGIFTKFDNLHIYENSALLASFCFLFTYIELFTFKITRYYFFYIVGLVTGFFGLYYVLNASGGYSSLVHYLTTNITTINDTSTNVATNALQTNNFEINYSMMYIIVPALYMITLFRFSLGSIRKNSLYYIVLESLLFIIVFCFVLFMICLYLEKIYNLYSSISVIFLIFFVVTFMLFISSFLIYYIEDFIRLSREMRHDNLNLIDQLKEYLLDKLLIYD